MSKKVFITLIIILLILICVILGILIKIKQDNKTPGVPSDYIDNEQADSDIDIIEPTTTPEITPNNEIIKKTVSNRYDRSELLDVNECIDVFLYECLSKMYGSDDSIYGLLDENYINTYGITEQNIDEALAMYYNDFDYIIKSMYKLNLSTDIDLYITYGDLFNVNDKTKQGQSFIIKIDKYNSAFSIFLDNYISDKNYLENDIMNKEIDDFEISDEVIRNEENTYKFKNYTTKDYAIYYFGIYNTYLNYDRNELYEMLNTEYREKRFGNIQNMNQYINDNENKLSKQMIFKYLEMTEEDYIQYVIIDANNRYYIMQVDSLNNLSIILDTYTLDLPEYLDEYTNANNEKKIKMNISRFLEAIRLDDCEYAYNKLDETFRENYFPSLESFETYAKNTFIYEEFLFDEFTELEGAYTYTVQLTNEGVVKNIIFTPQFLEGTDFRLLFNEN